MIGKDRITVWVALVASVMVHLFILLPGLVEASAPADKEIEEAAVNKSQFKRRVEDEDVEELHLGIDESEASTLTWVGYEEYEKHMARLADVEQAELQAASAQPVSGGAPAAPQTQPVTPQDPSKQPTTTETPPTTDPTVQPEKDQEVASNAPPAPTDPAPATGPESTDHATVTPPPGGLQTTDSGTAAPGETTTPEAGARQEKPEDARPEADPSESREPVPNPEASKQPASKEQQAQPKKPPDQKKPDDAKPQESKPPAPPTPPAAKPSTPGPGGTTGKGPPGPESSQAKQDTAEDLPPKPNAAKSDSSATSTIKVPRRDWLTGKPIAAAGLQLFPRKPKWTALQSVTSGGGKSLLVRLEFDSTGKPIHAAIARGSGNKRIDDVILASLYKWRARGKPLTQLAKGMRIPVQLEIVLTVK